MAYKVGMLDTDSAYQRAFMEYLNLRATIPIRLFTFTSEEALEQFCDQNTLDLLLVGDEMLKLKWKKQTVVLTKSREFEKKEHYIFRYQSMEMIVKYILDQMDQQHPNVENEYAFLAVYSPLGRCGKTEYAKKICRKFRRSLYVNWEGISSEKAEEGIGSWMIYCMKSRNEECIEYLQQHSCKKVPPPDSYQDITQVEKGDLEWFRDQVRKKQLYDAVVFDIGTTVLCGYPVLDVFDKVYVPELGDPVSKNKMQEFRRMFKLETCDESVLQYVQQENENRQEGI